MAADMPGTPFATCIYAVLDPAEGECVFARAGHLPPVITAPGEDTMVIDLPVGLPLGLGSASFEAATVKLSAGATIALYTDGLVESRSRSFDCGVGALCAALERSAGPAGRGLRDDHPGASTRQRGRRHPGACPRAGSQIRNVVFPGRLASDTRP